MGDFPQTLERRSTSNRCGAKFKTTKLLTCIGEGFSPNRWKCITDRMEYYLPSMDVLLFIVLYILITRGILRNIVQDFPCLVRIVRWLEAVKDGVPKPAAPVDFDIKSLKENSKQLQAKRHKGCLFVDCCGEFVQPRNATPWSDHRGSSEDFRRKADVRPPYVCYTDGPS